MSIKYYVLGGFLLFSVLFWVRAHLKSLPSEGRPTCEATLLFHLPQTVVAARADWDGFIAREIAAL